MKLGFITALPQESATLQSKKRLKTGQLVKLGDHFLMVAGMGPENAEKAAVELINAGADTLISWGCAAGLAPDIHVGAILLPTKIISTNKSHPSLHISEKVWKHFYDRISRQEGIVVNSGPLLSSEKIIATPDEKISIRKDYKADSLDMESYAIAKTAQLHGKSYLVVRAVSDSSKHSLPLAVQYGMNSDGSINPKAFISQLLLHPLQIFELIRLGKNFNKAQSSLRYIAEKILN